MKGKKVERKEVENEQTHRGGDGDKKGQMVVEIYHSID